MPLRLLSVVLLLVAFNAYSQSALEITISKDDLNKPLIEYLKSVENQNQVRFFFLNEWLEDKTVQDKYLSWSIGKVFDDIFSSTDLIYLEMYSNTVVIIKDATIAMARRDALVTAARNKFKILQIELNENQPIINGLASVVGKVFSMRNKEPLSYAAIQILNNGIGTTTNDKGEFTLSILPGKYVVHISFIDYEPVIIDLIVNGSGQFQIFLEESPTLLNDILIRGNRSQDLSKSKFGQVQLSVSDLKRMPTLLGEVDLVKQVQTLSGVTTVGEAASGFNVRGGSVDQNLILYDGLPVYNSAHAFGFFSAFNSESLRDITFYKGGIPAEYGGRVSSVLDIKSKDGDMNNWNGSAGIGLLTSNFMVSGPISKTKTSILGSFRSTYSNWLINSLRTDYIDLRSSNVSFYDGNIKVAHNINEHSKLTVSAYNSKDGFTLTGDSTYQWNTFNVSANLNHQLNEKLNVELVGGLSRYHYDLFNNDYVTASQLSYENNSSVFKAAFNLEDGHHKINFGLDLTHYGFKPGSFKPSNKVSNAGVINLDKQNSIESAFYISDDWAFNNSLQIEAGLRIPMFFSYGSADVIRYNGERRVDNIKDTIYYKNGETIRGYLGWEPRLSIRYQLENNASFKFGFNRMYQYLHLVTNTAAVTPVDIWQPSGYYFKPQIANQVSGGYFKDWPKNKIGLSGEVFYKYINNILDFKDGAQLILNRHLETDLVQGKGWSYGAEISLSKSTGKINGSLNYTYARSFRQIVGNSLDESINDGNRYPANYDQPHILNLSWKINLSRRYFFTGNFNYHTGRPITIPLSVIVWENTTVAYFSSRNQYRIPDYHRLDVALVIEGNHKRKKHLEGTWVISVYNVYARKNPYAIFFKSDATSIPRPYQLSIVGTVFPSISYNLKFR